MKTVMIFALLMICGGFAIAQEKKAEQGQTVILKSGEATVTTVVNPTLPKDCKDWNIAEIPGQPDTIFVCKAGKWIEYVQKDKVISISISKEKLAVLCAEEETEVPEPKPSTDKK
jgi:hypothetical protein